MWLAVDGEAARDGVGDLVGLVDRGGIRQRAQEGEDVNDTATKAVQAVRTFFERLWVTRSDQHEQLRATAEVQLEPLKGVIKGKNYQDLVEEGARQQLRARFELVSAQSVWDTLFSGST